MSSRKKIDKITEYKLVYIKWLDHNTFDGQWIEPDEIPRTPLIVETLGFLLDEDDLSYHVVSSICETGDKEIARAFWYILKSDVEQMVVMG